ncbi:MAG: single-stranded-DNA-specific exonuclease RecJ, partial [Oscillospiraceae bacterium]|nr:single-stranded-DNA-specific exonuclease RecJ [Oscillospiraceae bacterium]
MKYEQWNIPVPSEESVERLMDAGYPYLLSTVLAARGVESAEQAALALEREQTLTYAPLLMRDMDKAVARIQGALSRGEKIAVFGDYDVDGITATCLLTDYLRSRGGDVVMHIPGRFDEGYGLSNDAIRALAEQGVRLLVTVDCGITGVDETDYANALGVDVVITDHHECKERLPAAVAVVDPHRPDCGYPFKHLAGVGVALKLVLALGGNGREDALFARYCTLAAIGTIADVMRMEGENRAIVRAGLEAIDHSDFRGLHALLREAGLAGKPLTSIQVGFVLSPRINAAGRMGRASLAAELLLTDDEETAARLAHELCELNRERQAVEQEIYAKAVEQLEQLPPEEKYALVLASDDWHQGVVGIVASRLSEKYSCPSFMIHLADGVGKGSCRSYGGFNLFSALEACSDLLVGFGGHELAAGFTIEEANIPAFRRKMNRYVREQTGNAMPVSSLNVDAEITRPALVTLGEVERLSELEPYGAGNDRPVFCLRGALLESVQSVGQNRHLKVRLQKGHVSFEGIFFSVSAPEAGVSAQERVDAAFYLQINEFRGSRSVQLQLLDLRPARAPSAREAELLSLRGKLRSGAAIAPRDALRLLPSREQFVRVWRRLERETTDG